VNPLTGLTWSPESLTSSIRRTTSINTRPASRQPRVSRVRSVRGENVREQAARHRYLELLRSGGNDYPMEQLKKAGVDLSKPDTGRSHRQPAGRPESAGWTSEAQNRSRSGSFRL
jgi:hypothetical protein